MIEEAGQVWEELTKVESWSYALWYARADFETYVPPSFPILATLTLARYVRCVDEPEDTNTLMKFTFKVVRLEDSIIPNTCSNLG